MVFPWIQPKEAIVSNTQTSSLQVLSVAQTAAEGHIPMAWSAMVPTDRVISAVTSGSANRLARRK